MVFKRREKPSFFVRVREAVYPKRGWRRGIEYLGHRVKRLPDTPHRIALGFALGTFVSFTPLFGLHVLLGAGMAWLFRANIVASLIGTLVGNPVTTPFIAALSLALGHRILGHGVTGRDFGRIAEAFAQAGVGIWETTLSLFGIGSSQWAKLHLFFYDMVWPYFVGGLLPGVVASIVGYYLVRPIVGAYQERRRTKMLARAKERLERQKVDAGSLKIGGFGPGAKGGEA